MTSLIDKTDRMPARVPGGTGMVSAAIGEALSACEPPKGEIEMGGIVEMSRAGGPGCDFQAGHLDGRGLLRSGKTATRRGAGRSFPHLFRVAPFEVNGEPTSEPARDARGSQTPSVPRSAGSESITPQVIGFRSELDRGFPTHC